MKKLKALTTQESEGSLNSIPYNFEHLFYARNGLEYLTIKRNKTKKNSFYLQKKKTHRLWDVKMQIKDYNNSVKHNTIEIYGKICLDSRGQKIIYVLVK